ncbi:MAG: hypothetical protein KKA36_09215 [Gammaproteobacteria bacterium]|nr:hypothetical protein [Gammaproteobacteria bacterium]
MITHQARTDRWPLWTSGLLLCGYLLLSLWSNRVGAETARVLIVSGDSGGAYAEVIATLQTRLNELAPDSVQLQTLNLADAQGTFEKTLHPAPDLIVTVGTQASALAQSKSENTPVLSLLVSAPDYALLNQVNPSDSNLHSALYLDQPLDRQLTLLQLLLPKVTRLASLSGPQSAEQTQQLRSLCVQRNLQLSIESVAPDSNPIRPLTRLIDHAEVLIALPDPHVFNRSSIQAILLTTYRNRVPVIGFSQAYVRAGALAAVHSTAQQIGQQAGEWIVEFTQSENRQLGPPRYPRYYSVAVNTQVAQSLNLSVSSENVLLHQLQQLENRSP